MAVVYMITRSDDQKYIGVTVNFQKRLAQHRSSERFRSGIKNIEILFESDSYDSCLLVESEMVQKYDTFHNGLNKTKDGSGRPNFKNFTTKGYKFTQEARKKMRDAWRRKRENGWKAAPRTYSDESRKKMSDKRKGRIWRPTLLTQEIADEIRSLYGTDFTISSERMKQAVKKSDRHLYDKEMTLREFLETNPVSGNGRSVTYDNIFSKILEDRYNTCSRNIMRIINNEIWAGAVHHYEHTD